jgi:hypothetical protein
MQILVTGFLVSLVLWSILAYGALRVSLKLHRDAGLPDKWLLLVPYVITTFVYYAIRYRFGLWALDRQALHELFSIGSYEKADLYSFLICLPVFYTISIVKPEWVLRVRSNIPLLILVPFVLKLALYFSGAAGWEQLPAKMMPVRSE